MKNRYTIEVLNEPFGSVFSNLHEKDKDFLCDVFDTMGVSYNVSILVEKKKKLITGKECL